MAKTFQSFLMDGDVSGRIKCRRDSWTGIAYKIPKIYLMSDNDRVHFRQSGIYFLLGESDETGKGIVYVGQANSRSNGNGLLGRLKEHARDPDKDYWTEAVIFTSENNSLGATELSYLENYFCKLALDTNRFEVKNGNLPNQGNVTEEEEAELAIFIENAKDIMGLFNYKLFEPIVRQAPSSRTNAAESAVENSIEFIPLILERRINQTRMTVKAYGRRTAEGFVVLRGSYISRDEDETIPDSIKRFRNNASIDANRILQEDMLFHSSSTAAVFVVGKSASGPASWKTEDGRTLKSLEEQGLNGSSAN